jgi:hypothetical protein
MERIEALFAPLVGQLVWQVRRGIGSFLTLEFGMPHLSIREPIAPRASRSPKVRRNLMRRGVYVTGDWHLWVQYGDWVLSTFAGALTSEDPAGSPSDECIRDLDGQRFLSVESGDTKGSFAFRFDLGGVLEIRPSAEISDNQWSLYIWERDIVSCSSAGKLVRSERDPDGKVFKRL